MHKTGTTLEHVVKISVAGSTLTESLALKAGAVFRNLISFRSVYALTESGGIVVAPPQREINYTDLGFPAPMVEVKVNEAAK
ncbi:hypothetical protein IscW_ISCW006054 [Ixodes scapularis]|uniref:Uncharacterized protein n=1 Tax=Ixodes scapularis TaxID=6945 RepID=B7PQQ2_IXOSC|nr:hypothetical protein IscW_ISCW006054 [Ixodes scapularis]|eukprot:XP_002436094.1 hypothetical protein IscW_ISCW006054 [Ixodes scapularis]